MNSLTSPYVDGIHINTYLYDQIEIIFLHDESGYCSYLFDFIFRR